MNSELLENNLESQTQDCAHDPEMVSQEVDPKSDGNTPKYFCEVTSLTLTINILDFLWNDKNTLLLLEEYNIRKEKFRNPKIKKRNMWHEIVEAFSKHKYCVSEDILDKKFRNLKQTFMRIRDNQNTKKRTGKGNITWKFYELMCEIFAMDKTVNIEIDPVESSLPLQKKVKHSTTDSLEFQLHNKTPKSKLVKIDAGLSDITNTHEESSNLLTTDKKRIDDKSINEQDDVIQNTTPTTTRTKNTRKGLLLYRQELLKTEKQRVSEIANLRISMNENNELLREMVQTAKQKNKLLAKLVDIEEKRK